MTQLRDVAKYAGGGALPAKEREELIHRKQKASRLAQAGGVLGLSALATRLPQGVKAATAKAPRARNVRLVRRMTAAEPRATAASNTLTTLGAGIGATGSFNFAALQRQEAKGEKVRKRDDRFLRHNRDRISPKAEAGYSRMREDRNRFRRSAAISGALAGANAAAGVHYLRRRSPVLGGAAMTIAGAMGVQSAGQARAARGYEHKMETNIRAAARRRKEAGYYGAGRGLEPTDPSTKFRKDVRVDVAKALLLRKPMSYGVRRGGLVRLPNGRQVTRRGSIAGTGGVFR